MPPPEAVAGNYAVPDGKTIKVAPLTDEDRRTLVRWIDLGCPIDLDFDPKNRASPATAGYSTTTSADADAGTPRPGANAELTRIVVGMHDYGTGLDPRASRSPPTSRRRRQGRARTGGEIQGDVARRARAHARQTVTDLKRGTLTSPSRTGKAT